MYCSILVCLIWKRRRKREDLVTLLLFKRHKFKAVFESLTGCRKKSSIECNPMCDWWSTVPACEHYEDVIKQAHLLVTSRRQDTANESSGNRLRERHRGPQLRSAQRASQMTKHGCYSGNSTEIYRALAGPSKPLQYFKLKLLLKNVVLYTSPTERSCRWWPRHHYVHTAQLSDHESRGWVVWKVQRSDHFHSRVVWTRLNVAVNSEPALVCFGKKQLEYYSDQSLCGFRANSRNTRLLNILSTNFRFRKVRKALS